LVDLEEDQVRHMLYLLKNNAESGERSSNRCQKAIANRQRENQRLWSKCFAERDQLSKETKGCFGNTKIWLSIEYILETF
jgi:hypothetical protein